MYKTAVMLLLVFETLAVNGQIDSIKVKEENLVFNKVEEEATFPGGIKAWGNYLAKNLNPNIPVDKGAPAGRYKVIVKFIVGKTGLISNIEAETNNGYGTEQELIRIIARSGNWIPATQDGKPVNAYRRQPVVFMVEDENIEFVSKHQYVFYTGIDNILEIKVAKVKNEDLDVTISDGTIKREDGKYIVRVTKSGRIIVEVFNKKRNNKKVGSGSFEVRESGKLPQGALPPAN